MSGDVSRKPEIWVLCSLFTFSFNNMSNSQSRALH